MTETCPRCKGTGHIPVYSHRYGGLCLLCRGKGTIRRRPAGRKPRGLPFPELADGPTDHGDCDCPFC